MGLAIRKPFDRRPRAKEERSLVRMPDRPAAVPLLEVEQCPPLKPRDVIVAYVRYGLGLDVDQRDQGPFFVNPRDLRHSFGALPWWSLRLDVVVPQPQPIQFSDDAIASDPADLHCDLRT